MRKPQVLIDDILVDVSRVSTNDVVSHLEKFGLVTKPSMQLDGGTALGLKLSRNSDGCLIFGRNNGIHELGRLSKRELFLVCGKLVGH